MNIGVQTFERILPYEAMNSIRELGFIESGRTAPQKRQEYSGLIRKKRNRMILYGAYHKNRRRTNHEIKEILAGEIGR